MGAESDHLIFDYLSRVGDLAQTVLPTDRRVQLVTRLRSDIDQQRSGNDSPAAVRRILGRLGSPSEVVEAAAEAREPAQPAVPQPRAQEWWRLNGALAPQAPQAPQVPQVPQAPEEPPAAPWRGAPMKPGEELAGLPGMTGGLLIPLEPDPDPEPEHEEADEGEEDLPPEEKLPFWRTRRHAPAAPEAGKQGDASAGKKGAPGRTRRGPQAPQDAGEQEPGPGDAGEQEPPPGKKWRVLRRARREAPAPAPRGRVRLAPVETFAALLLVGGAVIGTWLALAAGWLLAYYSPRLSRAQAKFASLTLPGLVAGGALVWLWGRFDHRWGEPIAQGHMGSAIAGALPVVVRVAAVASAAFLVWRSRRA